MEIVVELGEHVTQILQRKSPVLFPIPCKSATDSVLSTATYPRRSPRPSDTPDRRTLTAAAVDEASPSPPYRILRVTISEEAGSKEDEDPIARTVWARMRAPSFTSPHTRGSGFTDDGEAWMAAGDGADDDRGAQPTVEVGFVIRVPRCVASGKRAPAAVVQYGHGLFFDRSEVRDGFLGTLAETGAWVLVSVDWRGMSRFDLPIIAKALISRPEWLFSGTPEDVMQVRIGEWHRFLQGRCNSGAFYALRGNSCRVCFSQGVASINIR